MITITCYGDTSTYEESKREELIKTFLFYALNSEGSEQSRYMTILEGLYDGETEISDRD